MKILVEHRSNANLGDTAMIEGCIHALRASRAEWELSVPDRPGLTTTLWSLPSIRRVCDYFVDYAYANLFSARSLLWRFNKQYQDVLNWTHVQGLGRGLRAGRLPLSPMTQEQSGHRTLGELCRGFDALHIVGQSGLTDVFADCLFQQCCLIIAFAEQRKPIILTGQQIGPLTCGRDKGLVCRTLRSVTFVGLREPTQSVAIVRQAKLARERFQVMGDDSFGMPSASEADVAAVLDKLGLQRNRFLAVNVRIGYYAQEHAHDLIHIAQIVQRIAQQLDLPLLFVPISFNDIDSDVRTASALQRLFGGVRGTRLLVLENETFSAPLTKGVMGHAAGALCVSYHACTFALSHGVPAICLYDGAYYAQKAEGLAEFWGDDRLALNLRTVPLSLAVEQILSALSDPSLRSRLAHRSVDAHRQWGAVFQQRIPALLGHDGVEKRSQSFLSV